MTIQRDDAANKLSGMDRKIKRKRFTWKKLVFVLVALGFLAFVGYVYQTRFQGVSLNVTREQLTVSSVSRSSFQELIPVMGNVLPIHTYFLDAVEGGRIEEVFLKGGAVVRQGDRILRFSNTSLLLDIMWREAEFIQQSNNLRGTRLSLEQARLSLDRELAEAENLLQQQKRTFERYGQLVKDKLIPEHDYEIAKDQYEYLQKRRELVIESRTQDMEFRKAQVAALEESLKRMQENMSVAKEKLTDLVVTAPVSGQLTALDAEVGQSKSAGQRLGQIDVLDGFKVRAEIDEHYLNRIQNGQSGQFDLAGKPFRLTIVKIYPEVKQGKFEVDLEFSGETPTGVRRGQTLHIRLELSEMETAVLVPRGAFYQKTGGNWIYVLDPSGNAATRRTIRLGRQNPDYYEVLEGLKPGEKVITSSYDTFGEVDRLSLK